MAKPLLPWAKVRDEIAEAERGCRVRTLGPHERAIKAFLRACRKACRNVARRGEGQVIGFLDGGNTTDRPTKFGRATVGRRTELRVGYDPRWDDGPVFFARRTDEILVGVTLWTNTGPRGFVKVIWDKPAPGYRLYWRDN